MKRVLSLSQWLITLLLCLFLIVPVVLSMAVGLTRNYIRGFKSGWTLDWVAQVWEMYHASIWMSLLVALCTLVIVLAGLTLIQAIANMVSEALAIPPFFLTFGIAFFGVVYLMTTADTFAAHIVKEKLEILAYRRKERGE